MRNDVYIEEIRQSYLNETDSSRLFTEALSAQVNSVLADKTSLVRAEAARMGFSNRRLQSNIFITAYH